MRSPWTLAPADDGAWDALNDESPQGSIFTSSAFLKAVCPTVERSLILEDGRVVGGVPVLMRDGVPAAAPYMYTPYHGPLLTQELWQQPGHRRVAKILELSTALVQTLAERYATFALGLHPSFGDARGFQWFHYGESDKAQASLVVRYTGLIRFGPQDTLESYLTRIRRVRRYEYTRAKRSGFTVRESQEPALLIAMLADTFGRQGLSVSAEERAALTKICEAFLASGSGRMTVAHAPDGEAIGATLFLEHREVLYYLAAATRTQFRESGANTLLFVESVERGLSRGARLVDVVGVNSPNRGDFKTSLGAEPIPYFIVRVA